MPLVSKLPFRSLYNLHIVAKLSKIYKTQHWAEMA